MKSQHTTFIHTSSLEGDLPTFDSAEEQTAYYAALGRLVDRAMRMTEHHVQGAPTQDTVNVLRLMTHNSGGEFEFTACYHAPVPATMQARSDGSPIHYAGVALPIEAGLQAICQDRPFVLGAVRHADKTFSFHS